jgi:hypothetical protein
VKTYRAHVYFEACASFDVEVPNDKDHKDAAIVVHRLVNDRSCPLVDTTVECAGATLHIEDVEKDIISIDVEEEPYEREEA